MERVLTKEALREINERIDHLRRRRYDMDVDFLENKPNAFDVYNFAVWMGLQGQLTGIRFVLGKLKGGDR